jgi:hypothetical protein
MHYLVYIRYLWYLLVWAPPSLTFQSFICGAQSGAALNRVKTVILTDQICSYLMRIWLYPHVNLRYKNINLDLNEDCLFLFARSNCPWRIRNSLIGHFSVFVRQEVSDCFNKYCADIGAKVANSVENSNCKYFCCTSFLI